MPLNITMAVWQVFLIFEFVYLLLPSGVISQMSNVVPSNISNQPCELADGRDGMCVFAYLCEDNVINVHGTGMVDLRFADECNDYFMKCCSLETPCADLKGTCVATNRCGVNINSAKYKIFKESDECEFGGYQCCPNEEVGKTDPAGTECDVDSICVPDAQCQVQPDGGDLISARFFDCSGHETCCPRSQIKKSASNPCKEVGGKCVRQGQCRSVFSVNIRLQACDEPGFECCMDSAVTTPLPVEGKSCLRDSGICLPRKECKGTVYRDRANECGGLVCCAGIASTTTSRPITTSTTSKPVNPGKSCVNNSGVCTPRKDCKGTVYRDRNNECNGLVCCAAFSPTVFIASTTTPRATTEKHCFNGNGICTLRSECSGNVYRDRKNECDGLVCCSTQVTATTTTTAKAITRTTTTTTTTTTRRPVTPGKSCLGNSGKCTLRKDCKGTVYKDRNNECEGLVCCAAVEPVRTCSSMKGSCEAEHSCLRRSLNTAGDCGAGTVCCLEVDAVVKECGYRNEAGIRFNTVNRTDGESQYGEFPWMVAIMINEAGTLKYLCGGSLVHPAVVLTSAECVKLYRRSPEKLTIRAGEWDMGSVKEPTPYQERLAIKIISHSGFKPTTLINNVALVFLDDDFYLSSTVNTVCLPPQDFNIDNGEVSATGWGTTPQDRKNYQQILKSIDLPYTSKPDCERALRKATSNRKFKLDASFLCAGGVSGVDTCSGDAGSPVIYQIPDDVEFRYYAVGMVSWGVGCGRAGVPAVYTDIGVFRDWIDRAMEEEGLGVSYYQYQSNE